LVTVIVGLAAVLVRSERGRRVAAREQAVAGERLRIAADLHDLVGHGLSTVAVQSSAARVALDAGDEQTARAALTAVESTSRAAMREVRQLLGLLRDVSADDARDDAAVDAPLPGLADIATLVGNVRAGGVAVTAQVVPEAAQVPAAVQLCAYRVVQEALTNAVKHAPGAVVTVRVSSAEGTLRVVVDTAGGMRAPRAEQGGGLGLDGIRARVAAAGGRSRIGATTDGWRVDAELPLRPAEAT
jgi:signal transduction histidine kinase